MLFPVQKYVETTNNVKNTASLKSRLALFFFLLQIREKIGIILHISRGSELQNFALWQIPHLKIRLAKKHLVTCVKNNSFNLQCASFLYFGILWISQR